MARSRAISLWLPVVAWAALIFSLSAIPSLSSGLGTWDYVLRKCAHVTEYAVLAAFLLRALEREVPAFFAAVAYAATAETAKTIATTAPSTSFLDMRPPSFVTPASLASSAETAGRFHRSNWALSAEELKAWWYCESEEKGKTVKRGVSTLSPIKRIWWITALLMVRSSRLGPIKTSVIPHRIPWI